MIPQEVLTSALITVVTIVITYLATSIIQRSEARAAMKEQIDKHLAVYHKDDIEQIIKKHLENCGASKHMEALQEEIVTIKIALAFLVVKQNGNPKEIGLIK
jgi:hypothetical protein